jgi:hypothetical protein
MSGRPAVAAAAESCDAAAESCDAVGDGAPFAAAGWLEVDGFDAAGVACMTSVQARDMQVGVSMRRILGGFAQVAPRSRR